MRNIKPASRKCDIDIGEFVDTFIDARNNPLKTFLINNKGEFLRDAKALSSRHARGKCINANQLLNAQTHKNTFKNLYKASRNELDFIDKYRSAYIGKLCPYCGAPTIETLDHYYPQDIFPHFSIIPDNLVPSCYGCNRKKGLIYAKLDSSRFIHPCFDRFSQKLIASIDLNVSARISTFTIIPHKNLQPQEKSILKFHFENLDLDLRLREHIGLIIYKIKKLLMRALENDGTTDGILNQFRDEIVDVKSSTMPFTWLEIVKSSIVEDSQVFECLVTHWGDDLTWDD